MGLEHDAFSAEECQRPTWEDHDLCVWHATVDEKTRGDFEGLKPEPGENIDGAYLKDASLVGVDWFADTSLVAADLTDAEVNAADFSDANLMLATMTDVSGINTNFRGANLEGAIFTNADLRRANLEDALLDEAVFTDVHIGNETSFGETTVYERDSARPTLGNDHPLEAAAWAYRQLQQMYRANALPARARRSYNREKDARRRLAWDQGDYAKATKWEVSRWVMKYGSSAYRVLVFHPHS